MCAAQSMPPQVVLQPVTADDLPSFFEFERQPKAVHMAAFTVDDPHDRVAFDKTWVRIMANPKIVTRAIWVDDELVGYLTHFMQFGQPAVGYWLGQQFWGRGIATAALEQFLLLITTRPLYARVAADNAGSTRVLEKCGFEHHNQEIGYSNARGRNIDEFVLVLN